MALDSTALDTTALDITVVGGTVRAYDSGGDGPPVVLLHPGVGDAGIWEPMLPGLTARYRVIRYDVRGYGNSPAPTVPYSMPADLVSVLDHFDLERVALVGCSMGGATALALAVEHPERVSALALLCPGVNGYEWPPTPELDAEYDALIAAGDLDGLTAWGCACGARPAPIRRRWPSCARRPRPGPGRTSSCARTRRATTGWARSRCRACCWSGTSTGRR
ncbi:alpha/beta fold hydrolase [Kitasatospora acidiphila]|uniref:alpha/beta fold hydrolase n=1 Tax=Kitasatospora acidiphila TaxID=2567942 RepID=UPI001E5AE3DE|nr:alpha/beta hydrolase [Kitasatospora acidiphila]